MLEIITDLIKMKKMKTIVALFMLFSIFRLSAQSNTVAVGGEATGSGGTVSFTAGEVFYTYNLSSTGSVTAGVQQAFEISTVLGVDDIHDIDLTAYPNPTVDVLNLKITNYNNENLSYQLFNIQGQLLATKKVANTTSIIGMESYAAAIYFLKIISNNKELKTFKIIKK